MRIQVVAVNHGTTAYADLLLRSLITHHPKRSELAILLLDNGSADLERLAWAQAFGVEIRQSGYTRDTQVTTHGEILRNAVLSHADCDAYLFVDVDVCFMADDTIGAMAAELATDNDLFAVQAVWSNENGEDYDSGDGSSANISRVRESVRFAGAADWPEPYEFDTGYGDRVHPFCVLLRNDRVFRNAVEVTGLSPAQLQCERGALWFDTLGLLTQIMKTHGRTWRTSGQRVIHFGNVSWDTAWAENKAERRDALLDRYAVPTPPR
ncbi:MAG: glycosyltransferase family 2 protein [Mycobacterium sp.]|nr:glycosyltransferase family 2 protein [Mycobacterium sp.]